MKILKSDRILDDVHDGKYDAVLIPMSIYNSMNKGFAYEVSLNFKGVRDEEKKTPYGDRRKYGTTHKIKNGSVIFIMCYIHTNGFNKDENGIFVSYDNLKRCLETVNNEYEGKGVATVIMGANSDDGNGDRDKILEIMENTCKDIELTVYDYEEKDIRLDYFKKIAELRRKYKERGITSDEYTEERSKLEWERRNGRFEEMPDGYVYTPKGKKIG
jgi:hypothetical protein